MSLNCGKMLKNCGKITTSFYHNPESASTLHLRKSQNRIKGGFSKGGGWKWTPGHHKILRQWNISKPIKPSGKQCILIEKGCISEVGNSQNLVRPEGNRDSWSEIMW